MQPKLFGVVDFRIDLNPQEAQRIFLELVATPNYNAYHLYSEKWDDIFPGDVVIKCQYCGQWAVRKTACKHCGGAIE